MFQNILAHPFMPQKGTGGSVADKKPRLGGIRIIQARSPFLFSIVMLRML